VGSRSKARARAQASQPGGQRAGTPRQGTPSVPSAARAQAAQPAGPPPRTVLGAAIVQVVEAAFVLLASILAGVDTGSGQAYQLGSGIAITAIGIVTALALALVARGLRAGRRWTRTPALLTQLFTGIVGIYLVQGGRYVWGIPALVLAIAGVGMLMAPGSIQLLTPGRVDKPGRG
jgi:hypothetical protein